MNDYDRRSEALWAAIDEYDDEGAFRAKVDELVAELPSDSPIASFERACAWDSTGNSDRAIPLYRLALEQGLEGERRRRAVIQMSSSLRNMGEVEESVRLSSSRSESLRTSAVSSPLSSRAPIRATELVLIGPIPSKLSPPPSSISRVIGPRAWKGRMIGELAGHLVGLATTWEQEASRAGRRRLTN